MRISNRKFDLFEFFNKQLSEEKAGDLRSLPSLPSGPLAPPFPLPPIRGMTLKGGRVDGRQAAASLDGRQAAAFLIHVLLHDIIDDLLGVPSAIAS